MTEDIPFDLNIETRPVVKVKNNDIPFDLIPSDIPVFEETSPVMQVKKAELPKPLLVKEEMSMDVARKRSMITSDELKARILTMNPKAIIVSSSDLKKLYYKKEERAHCPAKILHGHILKEFKDEPTLSMMKGIFFETLCLGTSKDDGALLDLPRKKISEKKRRELLASGVLEKDLLGEKTIDQERIELQANRFYHNLVKYQVVIAGENVQVPIVKYLGENVYLFGTPDIFPTSVIYEDQLWMAIMDLKLTSDIHSTFGEFSWGEPQYMDHIQAEVYHEIVHDIDMELNSHLRSLLTPSIIKRFNSNDYLFLYWVYGYKEPLEEQDKFVRVNYDSTKRAELLELVRKYVALTEYYKSMGDNVPTNPKYEFCKTCQRSFEAGGPCKEAKTVQEI